MKRRPKKDQRPEPGPVINERCLRYPDVRLLDQFGKQVGIIQTRKALQMAEDAGLDLVIVAANVHPPVARIVDYGKWKYEQAKREKATRKKTQETKGIKLKPGTAEQDLKILLRRAWEFLEEGHMVRFTVKLHPREVERPMLAQEKLNWFLSHLQDKVKILKPMSVVGRELTMVVGPLKREEKPSAKDEDVQDRSQAV